MKIELRFTSLFGLGMTIFGIVWLWFLVKILKNSLAFRALKASFSEGPNEEFIIFAVLILLFVLVGAFVVVPMILKNLYFLLSRNPVLVLDSKGISFHTPVRGFLAWENLKSVVVSGDVLLHGYVLFRTNRPTDFARKANRRTLLISGGALMFRKTKGKNEFRLMLHDLGVRSGELTKALKSFSQGNRRFQLIEV